MGPDYPNRALVRRCHRVIEERIEYPFLQAGYAGTTVKSILSGPRLTTQGSGETGFLIQIHHPGFGPEGVVQELALILL